MATNSHKRRRVRARISGTAERPRASVYRSRVATSVQLIDDVAGRTLLAVRTSPPSGNNVDAAHAVGKQTGEAAKKLGITTVVFDRGGYRYHGRVKAVAEGMREAGVQL